MVWAQGRDNIWVSLLQDMCVWPDFLLIYGEGTFTNHVFSGAIAPILPHVVSKLPRKEEGWIICRRENHLWSAKSLSTQARDRCRR